MPLVLYPLCILGLVLWAVIPSRSVGVSVLVLGVTATIGIGIWRVRHIYYKFLLKRRRLARELVKADESEIDDRSDSPLIREVFDLFDHDGSGDIGQRELYTLLELMYPAMPKNHRKAALHMVSDGNGNDARTSTTRGLNDNDRVIIFEDFDDVVLNWRKYAHENDPNGAWVGTRVLSPFRRMKKRRRSLREVVLDTVNKGAQDTGHGIGAEGDEALAGMARRFDSSFSARPSDEAPQDEADAAAHAAQAVHTLDV